MSSENTPLAVQELSPCGGLRTRAQVCRATWGDVKDLGRFDRETLDRWASGELAWVVLRVSVNVDLPSGPVTVGRSERLVLADADLSYEQDAYSIIQRFPQEQWQELRQRSLRCAQRVCEVIADSLGASSDVG